MSIKKEISGVTVTLPNYKESLFAFLNSKSYDVNSTTPGGYTYYYEHDTTSADITVSLDHNKFIVDAEYTIVKTSLNNVMYLVPTDSKTINGESQGEIYGENYIVTVIWNGTEFKAR